MPNQFNEYPIFFAAEMGNISVLKTLLKDPRVKPTHTDLFGDNILHWAAREGQLEMIQFLVN